MTADSVLDRRSTLGLLGLLGLTGLSGLSACGSGSGAGSARVETVAAGPDRHVATRIVVSPPLSYDKLVARFEKTVPDLPLEKMQAGLRAGRFDVVTAALAGSAVGMFLLYALDATPFMAAAGHSGKAKTYLMGNPLLAEKMFARDPGVMLYAPLRVLIHTDAAGAAHLVLDRPSDLFGGFDDAEIATTGAQIDATVAKLLTTMGLEAPAGLTA